MLQHCSEYEFARGASNDALIFVTCGIGVGAGIVLNDRLFTGMQDMAGEIGHSILQEDGALCSCGRRGCAETFFDERVLEKLKTPADGGAFWVLSCTTYGRLFNPSVLIVGGSACARYPAIVDVAREALLTHAKRADITPAPTVQTARYGLLAAAVGAAALVLHHELRPIHHRAFNFK